MFKELDVPEFIAVTTILTLSFVSMFITCSYWSERHWYISHGYEERLLIGTDRTYWQAPKPVMPIKWGERDVQ